MNKRGGIAPSLESLPLSGWRDWGESQEVQDSGGIDSGGLANYNGHLRT